MLRERRAIFVAIILYFMSLCGFTLAETVNVARNGAYILASSFEGPCEQTVSGKYYYDNLIDGMSNTTWRPMDATKSQWIQILWRYPVRVSSVICREYEGKGFTKGRVCVWLEGQWKDAGQFEILGKCGGLRCTFPEVSTTSIKVEIDSAGQNGLELGELEAYGPSQILPPSTLPAQGKNIAGISAVVSDVVITPEVSCPSSNATLTFKVQLNKRLSRDVCFLIDICDKGIFSAWKGDYPVATALIEPQIATAKWIPNKQYTLQTKIFLPEFSPEGITPVYIRALDKSGKDWLELHNVRGEQTAQFADIKINSRRPSVKTAKPAEAMLDFSGGQLGFKVNGEKLPPYFWHNLGPVDFERLYFSGQSGINIQCFVLYSRVLAYDKKTRDEHIANMHQQIRNALRVQPDTYFILKIDLRPDPQWLRQNPKELNVNAFGQTTTYIPGEAGIVSFASAKYAADCREFVLQIIHSLQAAPYADRIIGYHPWICGQLDSVTGGTHTNWGQSDRNKITIGDYNPQAVEKYRIWLRAKYKNSVSELQAAWKNKNATFDNAQPVISQLVKEGAKGGVFRDPAADGMAAFDYLEFFPNILGDAISDVAKVIKDATNGKALVFIHYGAVLAHLRSAPPGERLHNNNFDLPNRLMDSNIDGYVYAPLYSYRHAGQPYVTFLPKASLVLHDRTFLADDDIRTFTAGTLNYGRGRSQQETQAVILRDIGIGMTTETGGWLSDMSTGGADNWSPSRHPWYSHPAIVETFKDSSRMIRREFKRPHKSVAEIAVFVSCDAPRFSDVYRIAPIYHNLVERMMYEDLNTLGAPYDLYLMNDINNPKIRKDYKLYIFINPFYMSDAERTEVAKLKTGGKTLLWFYAPGYVDGKRPLDAGNISELVGMNIHQKGGREQMRMRVVAAQSHIITRGLPDGKTYLLNSFGDATWDRLHPPVLGPVFYVDDSNAAKLADYSDGRTAWAARDFGNWKSVYCALPYLDSAALRGISRYAGVHLYAEENVVLAADDGILMVTNGCERKRDLKLSLPSPKKISNAITGELLYDNTQTFTLHLENPQTVILKLE